MAVVNSHKALIPSISGNPLVDTVVAGFITGAGGVITGFCMSFLVKHNMAGPGVEEAIYGAVTGTLVSLAIIAWRVVVGNKTKVIIAEHVIDATATGEISPQIREIAEGASSISEEKIEQAVVNAREIKNRVTG